jgi:hypothetical protein
MGVAPGFLKLKGVIMVLHVLFWILLILTAIATFVPETPANGPFIVRGRLVIILILIACLGLKVFDAFK